MGAFGIFAAILTFVYVIYYSVMIGMDLFGGKAQKKESVEVISPTAEAVNESDELEEQPTVISEDGMPGTETEQVISYERVTDRTDTGDTASMEDIETADDNELYQKAMTAKSTKMEDVETHTDIEYTNDEYEDNLARLMQEQEAYAESLT